MKLSSLLQKFVGLGISISVTRDIAKGFINKDHYFTMEISDMSTLKFYEYHDFDSSLPLDMGGGVNQILCRKDKLIVQTFEGTFYIIDNSKCDEDCKLYWFDFCYDTCYFMLGWSTQNQCGFIIDLIRGEFIQTSGRGRMLYYLSKYKISNIRHLIVCDDLETFNDFISEIEEGSSYE